MGKPQTVVVKVRGIGQTQGGFFTSPVVDEELPAVPPVLPDVGVGDPGAPPVVPLLPDVGIGDAEASGTDVGEASGTDVGRAGTGAAPVVGRGVPLILRGKFGSAVPATVSSKSNTVAQDRRIKNPKRIASVVCLML